MFCSSAVMDFFVNSGSMDVKIAMASNESRISFSAIVRSLNLWKHSSGELMNTLSEVSKLFCQLFNDVIGWSSGNMIKPHMEGQN